MRIIAGTKKGYILNFPRNLPLRPTTDYCRESIFNILDNNFYFENIRVLELFAGTGSMSLEFCSRGCRNIISVDNNVKCVKWLEQAAENMGFEFIEAVKADAITYLSRFAAGPFDIIFADPPYDYRQYPQIPKLVFENELLNENGWLVIEHDKHQRFDNIPGFKESRTYGQSHVSFIINKRT